MLKIHKNFVKIRQLKVNVDTYINKLDKSKNSNMSTTADTVQKLQQELQNELTITNQLLLLISEELQKIKTFTITGGEFETTIKQNASLMATLANMQKLDIANLPPVVRTQVDLSH